MVGAARNRITAVLVRGPGQPQGDTRCGIEFEACLNAFAQLDPAPALAGEVWPARRFWPDRADWHGMVVPFEGGWAVRSRSESDDEPVWELEARLLRPG